MTIEEFISLKDKNPEHFKSYHHHKWLRHQILGKKIVKNVQTDPQTTDIWS